MFKRVSAILMGAVIVAPVLIVGLSSSPAGAVIANPKCGTESNSTITCGGFVEEMPEPPYNLGGYSTNEGSSTLVNVHLQFQYYSGGWNTFYVSPTFSINAGATSPTYAPGWTYGTDAFNVSLYHGSTLLGNIY
jgi:hypothetical protein